ncbi:MAG: aldose 1-epimerase family protein [Lachnospiraceae bacterium]|nr:aldose 1-epimerase family protein [Lachnospiraceae bacterium]
MDNKMMKYCGSIQQMIYVRPVTYREGRAEQMNAVEAKCGDIFFHSALDKALDISDFSYKGMNMTFLAKPGLEGRNHYDTNGEEALRSIMGGLFFTCGLENICAPCTIDGKDYPMHGRMRTTPAEHVGTDIVREGDTYKLIITGEMREAELFGENMVLRRRIESVLGENSITVTDEVENQAFRPEPLMLLYHCNLGYPFLDENCRLYVPSKGVTGREEFSQQYVEEWDRMKAPIDNECEYVYIHDMQSDENLDTMILVANHTLNIGLTIEFNQKNLPYFMEWKSLASGDYVLGLEPSNSSVYGKTYHVENDTVHYLKPFEKETNVLKFSVIEGKEMIEEAINKINKIKNKGAKK